MRNNFLHCFNHSLSTGIVIKPYMEQGVESYVQSVLESTFKTTKELIDQRRNPAIN